MNAKFDYNIKTAFICTMKILNREQLAEWDNYTITIDKVPGLELMERAGSKMAEAIMTAYGDNINKAYIFCGTGNNGGDGLVIARYLAENSFDVWVLIVDQANKRTMEFGNNLARLKGYENITTNRIKRLEELPIIPDDSVIIDALIGNGLTRPLGGFYLDIVRFMNEKVNPIKIAIDIPSGLMCDVPTQGEAFHSDLTLTVEVPKLAFFMSENSEYVENWHTISIELSPDYLAGLETTNFTYSILDAYKNLKTRKAHTHKGDFGHILIIAGSRGKMGAAILAARAALRAGCGLVTVHCPACGYEIIQTAVPEAMVSIDPSQYYVSELPDLNAYDLVAIGSGLDIKCGVLDLLTTLLQKHQIPTVIDADALNVISLNPSLFIHLGPHCVLTPHPGEFKRLFGDSENSFARLNLLKEKARELNCTIILKGHHTITALPDGSCYFNTSGNPGMSTAGSGDVLTGYLAGLLAQDPDHRHSCPAAVFHHGYVGDKIVSNYSMRALVAGDLVEEMRFIDRDIYMDVTAQLDAAFEEIDTDDDNPFLSRDSLN
jgi:NAD(P)H-hydrate epimerase